MVKVLWHKIASPPQMDGSITFARWYQCALPRGHIGATCWIRLNLCYLRLTRVHNPNGKSIGSAVPAQLMAKSHDTLQWAAPSPLKIAPAYGGIWTPIWHMVACAHPNPQPKQHLDGSSIFAGLTSVTDRQTDRPCYSVGNNRLHLRT